LCLRVYLEAHRPELHLGDCTIVNRAGRRTRRRCGGHAITLNPRKNDRPLVELSELGAKCRDLHLRFGTLALQLSKPYLLRIEGIRESHPVGYCGGLAICRWFWRRRSSHGTAPALVVLQTRAGHRSKAGGQRPLIARSVSISAGTAARCKE
jgi:hypothetical protein